MNLKKWNITLGFVFFGCMVAALLHLPLAWDGAAYALFLLSTGKAVLVYGRIGVAFIQLPAALSLVFKSIPLTELIFCLAYASIPLIVLLWSQRASVRMKRQDLLLWPLLHVTVLTVWGQAFFVSEGLIVCQLGWLLLFQLAEKPRGSFVHWIPIISYLSLHPSTGVFLILFGITGFSIHGRRFVGTGVALICLGVIRLAMVGGSYESMELRQGHIWGMTKQAFGPLQSLGIISGLMLVIACAYSASSKYITGLFTAFSVFAIAWAFDSAQWADALEFRRVLTPLTLLMYCLFVWKLRTKNDGMSETLKLSPLLGALFCTILTGQSIGWAGLERAMKMHVIAQKQCCTEQPTSPIFTETALHQWGSVPLSILVQNEFVPVKLVSLMPCEKAILPDKILLKYGPVLHRTRNIIDLGKVGICSGEEKAEGQPISAIVGSK